METYAIIKNGIVENVVIADDENFFAIGYPDDLVIKVTEETGQANVGVEFVSGKFVPMKPWGSWIFDESSWTWVAPVGYPQDGGIYLWDEQSTSWQEITLPE